MAKDYDKEDGVWRTIGGRKVFIRKGQNLADAMIESGKFKGQKNKPGMRESFREQKEKDLKEEEELYKKSQEQQTREAEKERQEKFRENAELYPPQKVQSIDKDEKGMREKEREKNLRNEIEKARERQDDETEEELDRKYNEAHQNQNKKIDNYLNRDTSKDKLNYNENTKEDTLYGGIPNRDKVLNEKARKDAFDYSREEVTKAYETMRDKMQKHMDNNEDHWSGKEYTNAEFLAHLEDANWHGEMKQLREANLTPEQLTEIKDKTTLSSWGVGSELTGKENVQKMIDSVKNKSTNETMNNAIREKASKNNTIPRDYEKITYTQKIDTNAGKKGDKFELYKDENGETHTKNLRTGETYQANMSMMKSPEAVEINDVVKKQTSNKILNDSQLHKMKWEDVVKANTDYFSEKSVYDFEGGRQGKYKYEDGWRDNGGAGVIKQSDLDRLIDKEDWERANKGYGRKYDSVDEAIADKDSALNQYIRDKANEKKAYRQYLKDHPNSKMSLKEFRNMKK